MMLTAVLALSTVRCVQDFVSSPSKEPADLTLAPASGTLAIGDLSPVFTSTLMIDNQASRAYRLELRVVSGPFAVDSLGRLSASGRGAGRIEAIATGPQLLSGPVVDTVDIIAVVPQIGVSVQRTEDTLFSINEEMTLLAVALTNSGDTIPGVPIEWATTAPGGATLIDSLTGRVRAAANGVATFRAAIDNAFRLRAVRVSQRATSLTASPDSVTMIAIGHTRNAIGTPRDALGTAMATPSVLWRALDPTIATVSALGVVSAVGAGRARVVALTPRAPPLDTLRDTLIARVAPARLLIRGGNAQSGTVGTPLTDSLEVQLTDSTGADVSDATVDVTFTVLSGGASFAAAGRRIVTTNASGRARARLSLGNTAGSVTVAATGAGLTGAAAAFSATALPASPATLQLISGNSQSATVASAPAAPFVTEVRDQFGNVVPGQSVVFTVTAGGGSFSGGRTADTVVSDAQGRAASVITLGTIAGTNGISVQGPAGAAVAFTATGIPGAPAGLRYAAQPSSVTAGSSISLQVTVHDAHGNLVTAAATPVTVALAAGTGTPGAALAGTTTVAAQSGRATFSNVRVDSVGTAYRLTAGGASLPAVTSDPFNVGAGVADHLAFSVEPAQAAANGAIGPVMKVVVLDAVGNRVTGSNMVISLRLNTQQTGVFGTTVVQASQGEAVFNDVRVRAAGNGYRFIAEAGALPNGPATSTAFSVVATTPAAVALVGGNGQNGVTGAALGEEFVVAVLDTFNNHVPLDSVDFLVTAGGGSIGGAGSALALSDAQGIARTRLTLGPSAGTNTVQAKSRRVAAPVTFSASATPAGLELRYFSQPADVTGGAAIAAFEVRVTDGGGVTQNVATFVTLSITGGTGTAGATLGGTFQVQAVNGVATFSNVSVDRLGSGYTLTASASGVQSAISAPFNVTVGAASRLRFRNSITTPRAAGASLGSLAVEVVDAGGNVVAGATNSISVAIVNGTGDPAATLSGPAVSAASNGEASFAGLSIDKAAAGYTLIATAGGLQGGTSSAFTVTAAAAQRLEFSGQPSNEEAGVTITPAITVLLRDAFGNAVSAGGVPVTLTVTPSTGTAAVTGGSAVTAGGAAGFAASVQRAGTGYTLTASSSGLISDTSTAFDITPGTPARLGFVGQPSAAAAGQSVAPAIQVAIQDAFGNTVGGAPAANVSLELVDNTGTVGAVLSGGSAQATTSGIAAFPAVSINLAGTGYQLRANASNINSAVSAAFNVTSSGAAALETVSGNGQSAQTGAALAQPLVVLVKDGLGNPVSGHTVWFVATSGGASFSGADSIAAVTGANGQAGATMTLGPSDIPATHTAEARAAGLAGSPRVFSASPVPVGASLAFSVQPSNATAGQPFAPQVRVEVRSQSGALISNATSQVTLAITAGTGTSGAQVVGQASVNAVGGVATFSVGVDKAGSGYTLTASASGLAGTVSSAFGIGVGSASRLAFVAQPTNTAFNGTMSPAVQVAVQDGFGNTVTASSASIGLALSGGTAGAALAGGSSVNAVNGIATFAGLNVNLDGTGYTLTAISGGLINAASNGFNVFGSPVKASFTTEPAGAAAGATMAPVRVSIVDATGTVVSSATGSVTLAILSGPAGGVLGGTLTVSAATGVASFTNLSLNKSGSYVLRATAGGLESDTSNSVAIAAGGATALAYSVEPASRSAGTALAPFDVTVLDAQGNPVTGVSTDVTVAIAGGTGAPGAILSGTLTRPSVAGTATFSDISIDRAASGYRLAAAGSGVVPDTSSGFNITVGPLASIAFTQSGSTLASLGQQTTFVAEGRDANGNVVPGLTFAWSSTQTGVASVSASGVVTAQANGQTTISATANGVTQQLVLTVSQVVNQVVITSSPATLASLNQTLALGAEARDANSNVIAGKLFTWTSDNAAVSVSGNIATAAANGAAGIRAATTGGVGGATVTSAPVTITVAQATASVVITPGTPVSLNALGGGPALSAQAFDALGSAIAGKTFAWSSTSGAVTVGSAAGTVTTTTAAQNGGGSVIAAADGKADTVAFTVSQIVTSVELVPSAVALASFNQTAQLTAVARDANGFAVAGPLSWSSDNAAVSVSGTGLVTANTNGSAHVTASSTGGAGGSTVTSPATVATVAQIVASVQVTLPASTLASLGETVTLSAVARDALGSPVAGKTFSWASDDAAVSVDPSTGVATAVSGGSAGISATTDGGAGGSNVTSPAATVTVNQVVVDVILTGGGTTLSAFNQSTPAFAATARDANGFTIPGKVFTWSSDNAPVSVNASGVATAQSNGSAGIRATTTGGAGGVSVSSAASTVTVQQIVASVGVTPGGASLAAFNATQLFSAVARDANGFAVAGKTFSWSSDNAAVGIDPLTGLATAVANGSAAIRAATDGGVANATVTSAPVTATVSQLVASVALSGGGSLLTAFGDNTPAFGATAFDANGFAVAGKTFSWSSDNAAVSVNASGVATAQANGSAGIRATTTSGAAAPDVSSAPSTVTVAQVVASVEVTPGSVALASFNQTQPMSALARDANGFAVAGKVFTWAGGNAAVAVDAASGLATALADGSAAITATTDGGAGGSNVTSPAVTVTVAQLTAAVVVTPGPAAIGAIGSTKTFTGEARDANGFAIAGKTFTWGTSAPSVAAIAGGAPSVTRVATALSNGSSNITATVDAVTGQATLTVAQVTASVLVTPAAAPALASFGATTQFTAVARDSNTNTIAGKTFTWTSLNPAIASVNSSGLATSAGNGTASIVAGVDGRADTSTVLVQQIVITVVVSPDPQTIPGGQSRTFTGEARDANGFAVAGILFNWSSSAGNPSVTSTNPSGSATVQRTCALVVLCGGSATITATTVGNPGPGGTNVAGSATAN